MLNFHSSGLTETRLPRVSAGRSSTTLWLYPGTPERSAPVIESISSGASLIATSAACSSAGSACISDRTRSTSPDAKPCLNSLSRRSDPSDSRTSFPIKPDRPLTSTEPGSADVGVPEFPTRSSSVPFASSRSSWHFTHVDAPGMTALRSSGISAPQTAHGFCSRVTGFRSICHPLSANTERSLEQPTELKAGKRNDSSNTEKYEMELKKSI